MPIPLSPPYNVTQPRQLDRWLDVNSQNGQLQRTQAFFTIPTFSIPYTFNQASEIIGDFWYLGPNAFSLLLPISSIIPDDIGYVICIAWIDSDRKVYRYKFNSDSRAVLYDIPLYTNQLIKKSFRIEIWNVDTLFTTVVPTLTFYTTVRGNKDYRYGVDFTLINPTALETNFNTPDLGNVNMALPFHFPNAIHTNV